jgi:hypothetical protein
MRLDWGSRGSEILRLDKSLLILNGKFNENYVRRILLDLMSSGIKAAGLKPDTGDPE